MSFKIVQTYEFSGGIRDLSVFHTVGAEFASKTCQSADELVAMARDADGIITMFPRQAFPRDVLSRLPKCRVISTYSNGYEGVDLEAASEYGICITNSPDTSLDEVSDHAMALLITCARRVRQFDQALRTGAWESVNRDKIMAVGYTLPRLRGKVLGLLGFGRIARAVVPKAQGFGMTVIAHDPYFTSPVGEGGVEMVDLDTLLRNSDFLSVHTALTAETRHFVGIDLLKKMKPTAYLINTARGAVVDDEALVTALSSGYIAGAGIDVFEKEPPDTHSALFQFENVTLTPHVAALSSSSFEETARRPGEEVIRVLTGQLPRNLLNPQVKDNFAQKWGVALV